MQLEGKRQNGRHAKNVKNTLCTFIPAPVPVPECTSTWVQVYTHVHQYLTKETLASNLKGKRQNVRHAEIINNTLRTYSAHNTMHPLTTFQVQVRHERRRTWSPQETTYLIASRDDVQNCPERRRTWSPRETTYAIAPGDNVQDSSRDGERASMITMITVSSSASRFCEVKWIITNLKSLVKASNSNCCNDTSKIVLVWNTLLLFH